MHMQLISCNAPTIVMSCILEMRDCICQMQTWNMHGLHPIPLAVQTMLRLQWPHRHSSAISCQHFFLKKRILSTLGNSSPSVSHAPSKDALRKANSLERQADHKGKLERLALPFRNLLLKMTSQPMEISTDGDTSPLGCTLKTNPKGTVSPLGYGLKEGDLTALNIPKEGQLAKLLSLDYCSQSERKRIVLHEVATLFSRRPNDTGSPEVQAALWSVKIVALQEHCRLYKHDYVAERKIQEWKDQRRKILRYLKRVSLRRYFDCLDRLGLPHDLVEAATSRFPLMPRDKQLDYEAKQRAKNPKNQPKSS